MSTQKFSSLWGMDESGRGALAGPLVAAAVCLSSTLLKIEQVAKSPVRDSKTLSPAQRDRIYDALIQLRANILTQEISVADINSQGIGLCNREIFFLLAKQTLSKRVIVDGDLLIKSTDPAIIISSIKDADATIPEVICAGIVAKVTRDYLMKKLHVKYPHYGWNTNKGYGTAAHIHAILTYGSTPYHRTKFVQTATRYALRT